MANVVIVGGPDVDARIDLMRHLNHGLQVGALGTSPALKKRFAHAGFDYRHYRLSRRANPFVDLWGLIQLVGEFRRSRPDIVHAYATKPSVWGRLAARIAAVPVVIGTLPGLGALYAKNDLKTSALRSVYQPLQTLACHWSDLTIFQNDDDIEQFIEAGIVTRRNATVVPGSGVSTKLFSRARISHAERACIRTELRIDPGTILVTMVSRVNRAKGVMDFCAAARRVGREFPQARFLLIGPRDEGVHRLFSSELSQLKGTVNWNGARRDISKVLAVSDIFVLPSAYREGVPRALLEAASMELPIVTTDSPGCREVVSNDVNGYLVPVHDPPALGAAIGRLIHQPQLRRRFGEASRRHVVRRFDISVIADQTAAIYGRLLESKLLEVRPA
jgi:glycosyltransferase involved in cell wall biosynthesis